MRTLVWFRGKDVRLADHEPLLDALSRGEVIPFFVVDPYFFAPSRAIEMPHRMAFLIASLAELASNIQARGSTLLFVHGKSVDVVPRLTFGLRADRVVAHRWSEPFGIERDRRIAAALAKNGARLDLFEGETLATPRAVLTAAGAPFSVFSPFARAFAKSVSPASPRPAPASLPPVDVASFPAAVSDLLGAMPTLSSAGLNAPSAALTKGGEDAATKRLAAFLAGAAPRYEEGRNLLGAAGTSRLSQDLKFGTLSARAVWHAAKTALAAHPAVWRSFSNELVWRDFAYDVLRSKPSVLERPFRTTWEAFPWRHDDAAWQAWCEGKTGYPVVDAAARQLRAEGFVHNRARMIAASFLCKHLLLDYRKGEAHYMKWLTDGDWASNNLGWQWSAGCGVDAQPWFRVFNPVTQGEKFDGDGAYVKRFLPEIAGLSPRALHAPWAASPIELRAAGVALGQTYPRPIVDHAVARARFLAAAESHLRTPTPSE